MIKIYCEDGATIQAVREIGKLPEFKLISFPFENRNKRTIKSNMPSHVTADSIFMTADNTLIKIGNTSFSKKYEEIKAVIGQENLNDIRHFDTAFEENCKIFITPDKKDIASKSMQLFEITGIMTFHCEDIKSIKEYCSSLKQNH